MLKLLLKKQFMELFKSYFVNPKTGKSRSKIGTVALFVLFAFLMVFLCSVFFGIAYMLGDPLLKAGLSWLYYALMSVAAVLMGTFGSVFNTYSTLYQAKDNEFLLSLPIPTKSLLTYRMLMTYAMSFLYSACVWLPTLLFVWIFGEPTALSVVFGVLLTFIIALFVTVLSCLLGWVVALIAGKLKNKSFITVIISLAFFGAYYYLWSKMSNVINLLVVNREKVGHTLKTWVNLIYQLGHGADGDPIAFLLFTVITAVLSAACFFVLKSTFTRILTTNKGETKAVYKENRTKTHGVGPALLLRELKHFCSSPTYMLNCGFSIIMLPAIAVIALIKRSGLKDLLAFAETVPLVGQYIPLAIIAIVCATISLNAISTPSISLEGKSLWILRTLPLDPADILDAKKNLHILLNLLPTVFSAVVLAILAGQDFTTIIMIVVFSVLFVEFEALFGLMIGILRPDFSWTTETAPIKQSLNPLIVWTTGWAIPLALGGIYYLLRNVLDMNNYLWICVILMALAVRYTDRWMKTKGVERFNRL